MEVTKGTWQFIKTFDEHAHTDVMVEVLDKCNRDKITRFSFKVEGNKEWFTNIEVKDDSHYLVAMNDYNNDIIYIPEFSIKLKRWISLDEQPVDGIVYFKNYEEIYEAANKEYLQRKRWKIFFDKYPELNEDICITFHYYEKMFNEDIPFEKLRRNINEYFYRAVMTFEIEGDVILDDGERLRKEDDFEIAKTLCKDYIPVDISKCLVDTIIYNLQPI